MIGSIIGGRYQVIKELGSGAFSQVYLAEDRRMPDIPKCVVKKLKPQANDESILPEVRRLFDIEAGVLSQLGHHPQIPQLLAHYADEFYLVEEFIEGQNLHAEIYPGNQLDEPEVIKILIDVLQILVFVHQNNVIHRDIKPSNLIRRESDGKIVLVDFGAVKQISTQVLNSTGQIPQTIAIGTQGYMPPEQVNGRPHPNSDIYALGRTAIQALTGLPSILDTDPNTGEVIWRQHAQVSKKLANILDKMILSDWRARYQSATEVLTDLGRITGIKQPLDVGRYIHNLPKWRIWIFGGIAGVILVAGIILFPLARVIFLFNQANRLVEAQEYREAIAIYDEVLEQYPDAVKAWINRGFALSKLNRTEEQLTSCNQALEIEPDLVEALNCRGLALQDLKRYEEAIFAYNNLVEIDPDFYMGWNNKGESLLHLDRLEEALTAFDKAILYQPDYFFAWNNRGNVLFKMQRYPEAIASYDKAIAINPNYHYAWNGRANTQKSLKRYQAAISDYNQAIKIKPNFYEAWYGKGLVLFGLQEYQEAIISFDQAIKIKPDYRAAIEKREESLRKLGR